MWQPDYRDTNGNCQVSHCKVVPPRYNYDTARFVLQDFDHRNLIPSLMQEVYQGIMVGWS
ncbi:MAG: hypothetical protein ETSY2_26135 [Candidatus Entotheonella gemina]|uniref:Uncharacterized protein n=1 Tax=Candidatus Entotheonella gemina TaxID=1429439 RepID=W4M3Y7_9BACT|nr:MAG: hypothetical protein ETSY2_26135 [Candidatus Entotheonella gemina]